MMARRHHASSGSDIRFTIVAITVFVCAGLITGRLFVLQVVRAAALREAAERQQVVERRLEPVRGEIFLMDRNGERFPLAINKKWPFAYAIPKDIPNDARERVANALTEILNASTTPIAERLSDEKSLFKPIKDKLTDTEEAALRQADLPGVGIARELLRYYPNKSMAAHIIGFYGFSGDRRIGRYGLEEYYDGFLQGLAGRIEINRAGEGLPGLTGKGRFVPKRDGESLLLSIDTHIQYFVEDRLKKAFEEYHSTGASAIVYEPSSGRVLALANLPTFDPNEYPQVNDYSVFLDAAVRSSYEPGSVVKPLIMALGIDTGKIEPDTEYVDSGSVVIGPHIIRNFESRVWGKRSMTQVLERSINTGAIFVVRQIEKGVYLAYLKAFGLGEVSGIDLPAESPGSLKNLEAKRDIDYATSAFGQGIAVTPIQLVAAMGAVANGGRLMQPYLVETRLLDDRPVYQASPVERRTVVRAETAAKVTQMMVSVVESGSGRRAKLEHFFVAGKTGTAQIPFSDRRGYSEDTIHTFVGFAPAFKPRFVALIRLDKPQGVQHSETSVVPVFKDIAEFILNYYEVVPDK